MSGSPVERKATLFCPSCSCAGPVDGEWLYRDTGSGTTVVCPDCRTHVATHRLDGRATFVDAVRAWNRAVLAPWRVWCNAVEGVELP